MIDPDALRLADRVFADELYRRQGHFNSALRDVVSDATKRGALGAGFFHSAIAKLFASEMRARADLLWDVVLRVLSAHGVAPLAALANSLKGYVDQQLAAQETTLGSELDQQLTRFGGRPDLRGVFGTEATRMRDSLHARADLLALELRGRAMQQASSGEGAVVQNFYGGTFGVVQAGAQSVATVTQQVSVGDAEATQRALDMIAEALRRHPTLGGYDQHELLGAVAELRDEVKKSSPSRFKLTQVASGLALAVQTSADLKPAYEVVRAAFLGWGITLPAWP